MVKYVQELEKESLRLCSQDFSVLKGWDVDELLSQDVYIIGALVNNELVGFVLLENGTSSLPPNIQFLEVLDKYRGRGIGTELISLTFRHVASLGYTTITLNPINTSEMFFSKFGFVRSGLIMEKEIEENKQ